MSKSKVTPEDVMKALDSLQEGFDGETVKKASEQDLDQPEGGDLGNPAKDKMSDAAKGKSCAKGEGEEEDEDSLEDKKEDAFEKKAKKSFAEVPEEVQTKIEVSDFLKSLVDHNVDGLTKLAGFIAKSDKVQESRYDGICELVEGLAKSQAKIGIVLKAVCEKIGIIENSPAAKAQRSDAVQKSEAAAPERLFKSGLETEKETEQVFKGLSGDPMVAKSQLSNALCDLVMKGEAQDMDVINFESAGFIRPELIGKLKGKF